MATATTEAATSSATPPRIVSLTRVGIRLRTGSESSADGPRIPTRDPPSPSTELNTSSRVAGGGSSGSSGRCSPPPSRSRVQWSTQNSIIKSFATGTRGTMTVSWEECPRSALIVKKWNSTETAATTLEIGGWLEERGVHVYVQLEDAEAESNSELARRFDRFDANSRSRTDRAVSITRSDSGTRLNLVAVSEEFGSPTASSASGGKPLLSKTPGQLKRSSGVAAPIDFIVCLGGDGTMIFASSLFPFAIPPMVSFNLGSLGFLTPFSVGEYAVTLGRLLTTHDDAAGGRPVPIELRMRLEGSVIRRAEDYLAQRSDVGEEDTFNTAPAGSTKPVHVILNEVLVDRGPTAYMTMIDAYVNGAFLTTVQADGIIIATPTGSTAYSLSAGGPIVAPSVPCILFTPVCPHTLSFRPLIFPDSSIIRLQVPDDARHSAWVSFDGKEQTELRVGDAVEIRMSESPLPVITRTRDPAAGALSSERPEWITSIDKKLGWNVREQPGMAEVETRYLRLFLVRHGESRWNAAKAKKSIIGLMKEVDHPLSELGVAEAVQTNNTWRRMARGVVSDATAASVAASSDAAGARVSLRKRSATLDALYAASEGSEGAAAAMFGDDGASASTAGGLVTSPDTPALGIAGDAHAGLLANFVHADVLCASPLSRALQTALLVLAGIGAERYSSPLSSTDDVDVDADVVGAVLPTTPRPAAETTETESRKSGALRLAVTKIHRVRGRFARVAQLTSRGFSTLNASKELCETNAWTWSQVLHIWIDPKDDTIFRVVIDEGASDGSDDEDAVYSPPGTAAGNAGAAGGGQQTSGASSSSRRRSGSSGKRKKSVLGLLQRGAGLTLRFQAPTVEACARFVDAAAALSSQAAARSRSRSESSGSSRSSSSTSNRRKSAEMYSGSSGPLGAVAEDGSGGGGGGGGVQEQARRASTGMTTAGTVQWIDPRGEVDRPSSLLPPIPPRRVRLLLLRDAREVKRTLGCLDTVSKSVGLATLARARECLATSLGAERAEALCDEFCYDVNDVEKRWWTATVETKRSARRRVKRLVLRVRAEAAKAANAHPGARGRSGRTIDDPNVAVVVGHSHMFRKVVRKCIRKNSALMREHPELARPLRKHKLAHAACVMLLIRFTQPKTASTAGGGSGRGRSRSRSDTRAADLLAAAAAAALSEEEAEGGEGEHVTAEADLGPKWAFEAIDARMMFGTSLMMALSRVQLVDIVERGLAACTALGEGDLADAQRVELLSTLAVQHESADTRLRKAIDACVGLTNAQQCQLLLRAFGEVLAYAEDVGDDDDDDDDDDDLKDEHRRGFQMIDMSAT